MTASPARDSEHLILSNAMEIHHLKNLSAYDLHIDACSVRVPAWPAVF